MCTVYLNANVCTQRSGCIPDFGMTQYSVKHGAPSPSGWFKKKKKRTKQPIAGQESKRQGQLCTERGSRVATRRVAIGTRIKKKVPGETKMAGNGSWVWSVGQASIVQLEELRTRPAIVPGAFNKYKGVRVITQSKGRHTKATTFTTELHGRKEKTGEGKANLTSMKMARWYQCGSPSARKGYLWTCLGYIQTYRIRSPDSLGIEKLQNDGGTTEAIKIDTLG